MSIKNVTFFGYADSKESDKDFLEVRESARLLAEAGYTIVNGGGPGLMRAASVGAKEGGGQAVGVTFYPTEDDQMIQFEGRDKLNPIDEEIKTGSYVERTLTLIEKGDVMVVCKGGTGTISEFGMAWGLARLHFGHHKHLILYGAWWHDILEAIAANMFIRSDALEVYHIVDSPEEVLETVERIAKEA